jgi:tetratricopeptide (TPR) repeat protein
MNRTFKLIIAGQLFFSGLKAQTIQEGMNHLYAKRDKSAMEVFQKLIAANKKNMEAIYWLGQTYINMDDNAAARQLYEKVLSENSNTPLLVVGMGHIELLDNKNQEAKQHFDKALETSRTSAGDDPLIQTAIGRAIIDSRTGDFKYAVEILKAAVARDPKNTETLLQLGNAYRKADPGKGGSDAYIYYNKALAVNPNFAPASVRLAKMFETQQNWTLFLQYLNEAVAKDPQFSDAYFELFYYYFYRGNYQEAEAQLNKFIVSKLPESDPQDQFLYAQLCWARKDFVCVVNKAEMVIAALDDKTKPKVYKLLAYSYFEKGDYSTALKNINDYFGKQKREDLIPGDYKLKADILAKTGGTTDEIYNTYIEGAALDPVLFSKVDFLRQGADVFKAKADIASRIREGDIRLLIITSKLNESYTPSLNEFYDAGFAYFKGNNLYRADSLFEILTELYPDEKYGWERRYTIGRINDSTMLKGLAVPFAVKYLELLEKDATKNKKEIISTSAYLATYYANIKKDRPNALVYLKKMLALEPDNVQIQNSIRILEGTKSN